jgi:hypothetical protein
LFASQSVAVREVVKKLGHGRVDYVLYVDKAVVGRSLKGGVSVEYLDPYERQADQAVSAARSGRSGSWQHTVVRVRLSVVDVHDAT